ncbi:unnamed protein product [Brassicogethes aeneus]|uniref:Aspartyl-tRNA synthetase n=1 Tax=Brassicogethes aeneus TaxID=1431903 RepID=A0A9P0B7C0_BRAAE|nr:unnamed protein product [Brassicogethes aeneus]
MMLRSFLHLGRLGGLRASQTIKNSISLQVTHRNNQYLLYSTSKSQNVYLVYEENDYENKVDNVNKFTNRTYTCGELRSENIGENVNLCGWLEYQRMNKFIVLRDSYGETQLILKNDDDKSQKLLSEIPLESIIQIQGTVLSRPKDMFNKKQVTGEVEVRVENLKVLNKARDTLPFNIREFQKAKESLRMQYRYLDLRFPQMQRNLRVRSEMLMKMREFLVNNHFVDVETPTLFKATPGGAQEFVVPTKFPGQFYSLVQSPQQFKQMLMAGALDRYFQIARCYRDEGSRPDRQPEFTQLDIELSFTDLEGVLKMIEELLCYSWPTFHSPLPNKFSRMCFKDAMENYGTDQPDVRFEYKLQNCTDIIKLNESIVNKTKDFGAYYLQFPKEYANLSKSVKDSMSQLAKKYPNVKLIQNKISNPKDWSSKVTKLLSDKVANRFIEECKLKEDSILFMAYGDKKEVLGLLGKVRLEYVNFLENLGVTIRKKGYHFLWVVDFPLFEIDDDGNLGSPHHPFTSPHPDDVHLLETNPLKVRALSYDLVLNGNEVGGGSIRIHDPLLQETLLKMLKIDKTSLQHILDMLASGCPPHGGIALGLDRLLSFVLSTTSIRDVIAFPKTFEGRDPVSGAPSTLSEKDQKLYHIQSLNVDKS